MAESAKKVARQAEERLNQVAENVRKKFDRVTRRTFSDTVKDGRFADRDARRANRGQAEPKRGNQGEPQR
ncbi:hypothetical protein [Micromonospora sp. WMMD708]|uniref:hypothetical protein n=1 Tax=Micromonospora sp. WMMD708 TaxID=3403464 RepID=UPI003BF55503